MANINATAIVNSADILDDRAIIGFESVKRDDKGDPTFSIIMEMAATHPAVKVMLKDSVMGLCFSPTGAVHLEPAVEAPKLVLVPEPVDEVDLSVPKAETTEWKEGAAVTSPALINPPISDLKRALGVAGGAVGSSAPTSADAFSSARSQYAGDL